MKTFFVHHASPHHAKNSGYNRLIDYYPEAIRISGKSKMPYKLARLLASLHNQKAGLYNSDSIHKEIELWSQVNAYKNEKKVIHYLNAERDIRHIVNRKKFFKNSRFCGTFHKPPDILNWRIENPKYIKLLNGAIAVGVNQVEDIKERLKIPNVTYIPHGVDTNFFQPDLTKRKFNRLVFVGQHLRDFDALNYCIPRIAERIKKLSIHVILHPSYIKKINEHKSITVFSSINDSELKRAYQEASLLFLPMLNSTACNSILEALACGLPIITTDVGGNKKYLEGTKSVLVENANYEELIESTIKLLKTDTELIEISKLARLKAKSYDWKIIANKIREFHELL